MSRPIFCDRCKEKIPSEQMTNDTALVRLNNEGQIRKTEWRWDLCDICYGQAVSAFARYIQGGVVVTDNADENWQTNAIQFPRLLSELRATDLLTETVWEDLQVSMDLDSDQLTELFDRAEEVWTAVKKETPV